MHVSGVEKTIIYPHFNGLSSDGSDIALLKLNTSVESYTPEVRPVCMPQSEDAADSPPYDNCWVAGWGLLGKILYTWDFTEEFRIALKHHALK